MEEHNRPYGPALLPPPAVARGRAGATLRWAPPLARPPGTLPWNLQAPHADPDLPSDCQVKYCPPAGRVGRTRNSRESCRECSL